MNITYTQNGDYLIPNIIIRKTKPLGHYGRLRKAYLEMHRPILFNELVLSDKLSRISMVRSRNWNFRIQSWRRMLSLSRQTRR